MFCICTISFFCAKIQPQNAKQGDLQYGKIFSTTCQKNA